ncbi:MAG: TetR/AcrR family transcriptional regulator, partial [Hypericibacter sp.]
ALQMLVNSYLSTRHLEDPGRGCLLSSLGTEIPRQSPSIRHNVTEGLRSLIDSVTKLIPGRSAAVKRKRALAVFSSLVGAMVLARAVDDPAFSEEIRHAVSASLTPAAS